MEAEELRQLEAQRVAELIAKQEQQRLERAHQEKMVCQACDFAYEQCIALVLLLTVWHAVLGSCMLSSCRMVHVHENVIDQELIKNLS